MRHRSEMRGQAAFSQVTFARAAFTRAAFSQVTFARAAFAVAVLMFGAIVGGCGNSSDTTTLESTTTTARGPSTSAKPSDETYQGLVETLTKMGISKEQARCVVDKMDAATANIGDSITPEDQSRIEELLKECKITG